MQCKLVGILLSLVALNAPLYSADHEALGVEESNCPATSRHDQHASYQACHDRTDGERCGTITSKTLVTGLIVPQVDGESLHCTTQYDTVRRRAYPCCAARLVVTANGVKQYLPVDFTQFNAAFVF